MANAPLSPTLLDAGDRARADRTLLIARLYYFAFFAALGAIVSFFNVYLQERGLSGTQIGLMGSVPPFVGMVSNPFWGAVADRRQAHQRVLVMLAFGAGALSLGFIWVERFWSILALFCLLLFFRTPISPLLDSTVIGIVARYDDVSYGRQRVFGSFGWILASFSVGFLVSWWSIDAVFWLHGLLLAVGCALLSLRLPVEPSKQQIDFAQGLRSLLANPVYRSLALFMLFFGAAASGTISFAGLNILALGGGAALVGMISASNALLEIPVMFVGDRWVRRIGPHRVILLSSLGYVILWLLIALAVRPWQVLLATAFTGAFFGLTWIAMVGLANESAPDGLRATAQAITQAAHGGLGWAIGTAIAGVLWDWNGGRAVFSGAAVLILIGVSVFALGTRRIH